MWGKFKIQLDYLDTKLKFFNTKFKMGKRFVNILGLTNYYSTFSED